jgi:hypothetical protein
MQALLTGLAWKKRFLDGCFSQGLFLSLLGLSFAAANKLTI